MASHCRRHHSCTFSSSPRSTVRARAAVEPERARGSDYATAAKTFVSSFFYDGAEEEDDAEFRSLTSACAKDMRRRYGSSDSLRVITDDEGCVACGGVEVRTYAGARDYEDVKRDGKGETAALIERPVVANLATARRARKKGYGKAIMRSLEELCLERGFDECVLVVEARNKRAQGFYKKLGYRVIGSESKAKALEVGPDGRSRETYLKTLVMRKSLTNAIENVDPITVVFALTALAVAVAGQDAVLDFLYDLGFDV
ncbi:Acyl-CoA N-acyltransferase [Ostreococcus tauri]|uniref:Acyl-CoA N-acyltransferase n=1 Tax=Ostreococcus tauri TaxID=70448 RepID=Q00SY1_OSTTA|nr:Acyl-CoA N-acyltransferase [Ostreococcus tauri]CAL58483.1 Acyl-CoA N-acyltransferase [Ostreococcus tauri]|eukprot:XP_003084067.1 Acyl-CoA N-acyltransferase [Ostreococcus tauri]